jgi:hypothetical protein
MCITYVMGEEVESHGYRLGSPPASVAGMAERMLERTDLSETARADIRAIRDLALEALEEEERVGRSDPRHS